MIERRKLTDGSTRWKARVKNGGNVVAQKTFKLRRDAEVWEREQYRALALGNFVSPRLGNTPISDVIAIFLRARVGQISEHSYRTDRDNLIGLPSTFLARPIASVGESEVLNLLTDLLAFKAHSTVARVKTSLSALFTWAVRERFVTSNPARGVRMPSGSIQAQATEWFTSDDVRDLVASHEKLSPHYARITSWLALTGLRWSEARALRVRDVQSEPYPSVRVHRAHSEGYSEKAPKSSRGARTVPLVDEAVAIAAQFAAAKNADDYLLTTVSGKQLRLNLYRRYTNWSTTSDGRRGHHLRHFAASQWLRKGIPVNQVAAWLGDDPRTVLKVYAHVMGEQQDRQSLGILNALASAGPSGDPQPDEATEPN